MAEQRYGGVEATNSTRQEVSETTAKEVHTRDNFEDQGGDREAAHKQVIRTTRYVECLSNIVPVIKKNGTLRVYTNFRDLNNVTPKEEYPMPVVEMLVDSSACHEHLSMLDGFPSQNQIFIDKEDVPQTTFRCLCELGSYECIVMLFGLKNAGTTYQRAMNYMFYDSIKIFMQVY